MDFWRFFEALQVLETSGRLKGDAPTNFRQKQMGGFPVVTQNSQKTNDSKSGTDYFNANISISIRAQVSAFCSFYFLMLFIFWMVFLCFLLSVLYEFACVFSLLFVLLYVSCLFSVISCNLWFFRVFVCRFCFWVGSWVRRLLHALNLNRHWWFWSWIQPTRTHRIRLRGRNRRQSATKPPRTKGYWPGTSWSITCLLSAFSWLLYIVVALDIL